jgi:hypothetical protein
MAKKTEKAQLVLQAVAARKDGVIVRAKDKGGVVWVKTHHRVQGQAVEGWICTKVSHFSQQSFVKAEFVTVTGTIPTAE